MPRVIMRAVDDDNSLPRLVRQRKRPLQTRARDPVSVIERAAAHILVTAPAELTTNAVARRAGVSIGSLYQYYPNKEALLAALMKSQAEAEAAFVLERLALARPETLLDAIRAALQATFAFRRQNPELQAALLAQLNQIPQFDALVDAARTAAARLRELLLPYRGDIQRPNFDLAVHVVCNAAFSVTHWGLFPRPPTVTDEELCTEVVALLHGYLSTA